MKTAAILFAGLIFGVVVAFWGELTAPGDMLRDIPLSEIESAANRHCQAEEAASAMVCECMVEGVVAGLSADAAREVLMTAAFIAPEGSDPAAAAGSAQGDGGSDGARAADGAAENPDGAEAALAALWQDCVTAEQRRGEPPAYAPPQAGMRLTLNNGRVFTIDSSDPDLVQYFVRDANWRRQSSRYYRSLILLASSQGLSNRIEDAAPLERLWPLAVGNHAEYKIITRRFGRFLARRSEIAEVLRTETLTAGRDTYETFVVQGRWQVTNWLDSGRQFYDSGDWTAWYSPDTGTWLRWEDNIYRHGETVGSSRMEVVRVAPM